MIWIFTLLANPLRSSESIYKVQHSERIILSLASLYTNLNLHIHNKIFIIQICIRLVWYGGQMEKTCFLVKNIDNNFKIKYFAVLFKYFQLRYKA